MRWWQRKSILSIHTKFIKKLSVIPSVSTSHSFQYLLTSSSTLISSRSFDFSLFDLMSFQSCRWLLSPSIKKMDFLSSSWKYEIWRLTHSLIRLSSHHLPSHFTFFASGVTHILHVSHHDVFLSSSQRGLRFTLYFLSLSYSPRVTEDPVRWSWGRSLNKCNIHTVCWDANFSTLVTSSFFSWLERKVSQVSWRIEYLYLRIFLFLYVHLSMSLV